MKIAVMSLEARYVGSSLPANSSSAKAVRSNAAVMALETITSHMPSPSDCLRRVMREVSKQGACHHW